MFKRKKKTPPPRSALGDTIREQLEARPGGPLFLTRAEFVELKAAVTYRNKRGEVQPPFIGVAILVTDEDQL